MNFFVVKVVCLLALVCFSSFIAFSPPNHTPHQTEFVRATIFGSMANSISQSLLPFTIDVSPADRPPENAPNLITLVDVRYCGTVDSSRAKLLAIGHPGSAPGQQPPPVLGATDCQTQLANIAQRALTINGSPDWVAVAEISATWNAGDLNLSIKDVVTDVKPGAPTQPASTLASILRNDGRPFKSIKTSRLKLTLEGKTIEYNVVIQFVDNNILLTLLTPNQIASPVDLANTDSNLSGSGSPALTNVILKAPYSFISSLLSTNYGDTTFVLERTSEGNEKLTARNLRVSGSNNGLSISGLVRDIPTNTEGNLSVNWTGEDLQMSSVRIGPIQENCGSLPRLQRPACNIRNEGRRAAASLLGNILTTRYRNLPFRPVGVKNLIPFELEGRRYNLRTSVLRSQSTPTSLYIHGNLIVEAQ